MASKNNTSNVSVGKPVAGGAVFTAPAGTALPTDAKTALDAAYACLGCISEDGVVNTNESDSEEFVDWEGSTVETAQTSYTETYQMTFIEHANPTVLKAIYGDSHVTVAENGAITIKHTADEHDECVLVIDTILKKGRIDRLVIPRAKISEIGDINRKRDELIGYETTFTALADDNGACTYEYISEPAGGAAHASELAE